MRQGPLVWIVLVFLAAPLSVSAQQTTRQVFVTVLDQAGAPILDLGRDDFQVQEDSMVRPIVRVGLANDPMRVAMLIDNSDAAERALLSIRSGVHAFLDALPAEHEVSLLTVARQLGVRAEPTVDRAKLKEAADLIFIDGGSSAVLLDALLETDERFLQKAEDRWPVFVLVTTDGAEGSRTVGDNEYNAFVADLIARGVTVHAILISTRGGGRQTDVATNLTENTGGHYQAISASTGLPDQLRTLAEHMADQHARMATQYQITFTTDAAAEQLGVRIGVRRPAGNVIVSMSRPGL
jgi:hypothetical protein